VFGTLLILPAATAPAAAQAPAAPPPPQAGPPPAGSVMEPRLRQIHQMLHITPAQEADFNAFANALRGNEATMRALFAQRPPGVGTNAVESLRFEQRLLAAQAEGLRRLIEPFSRLYAALSPTQKNIANRIFTRPAAAVHG
jgi:hypothetical protein